MLDPRIKANWKWSNEMARVNVNILGISELKRTGMGEFNSDDHYIYYCGQESLRRNGVAIIVNKRVLNTVLGCSLKNDRMISVCFQGKPFKYIWLECKSRKSRNTWIKRQIWPWSTEWSKANVHRVLPRECTDNSKHHLQTTQERTLHMDIIRWSILKSDWLYSLQPKWRSSIESAKTRLGANCGSDHELLINKFRLKLKKVWKTTRPFRYDLK